MATATITNQQFVDAIAAEMAYGVDVAVESWMAEIDAAMNDLQLTTLGKMNAIKRILENYKRVTGKTQLVVRRVLPEAM